MDVKYLPKNALIHGDLYEGYTDNGTGMTAKWDSFNQRFIGHLYGWDEASREIQLSHPDDQHEYYFTFYPLGEA